MNIDEFYNKYVKPNENDFYHKQIKTKKFSVITAIILFVGFTIFYIMCTVLEMNEIGGIVIFATICFCILSSMKAFEKNDFIQNIRKEIIPLFFEKCYDNIKYECNIHFDSKDKKNLKGLISKNAKYGDTLTFSIKNKVKITEINDRRLLLILPFDFSQNTESFDITTKFMHSDGYVNRYYRSRSLTGEVLAPILDPFEKMIEGRIEKIFDKIKENKNIVVRSEYYDEFNQKYEMHNISKGEIQYKEKIIGTFLEITKKYNISFDMYFKNKKLYILINDMSFFDDPISEILNKERNYINFFNILDLKIKFFKELIDNLYELENYL